MRDRMIDATATVESTARIELFYDGECPLCSREVGWLASRDRAGRVAFIDIAAPDFDAQAVGKSMDELMGSLHARTRAGVWLTGMDVFRAVYAEVGLGRWLAPTGWPVLRPIFDLLYAIFARIRPYLPGRARADCGDRCSAPPARRSG